MQIRHQFPMVRLLFPFLAGILTAIYFSSLRPLSMLILMLSFIILTIWVIRNPRRANYRNRWIFGIILHLFLFIFGFNLLILNREIIRSSHFSHFQADGYIVEIEDAPQEKPNSWKLLAKMRAIKSGEKLLKASGRLLVYLSKDSSKCLPAYGDVLYFVKAPEAVPPPVNPGSFDYRKYLAHHNIYQQIYLRPGEWRLLKHNDGFSVRNTSLQIRQYSMDVLERYHPAEKDLAIAAALLIGQDDLLDYETRQEYSNTGVVHILGISGLHVGIIYLALNLIFGFLDKKKQTKLFKLVLVILLIWLYALVTGLSAAALRSAAMFTFVTLGNAGKRNVHIINSLATSAFVLLLYDPYLVTNIGFQFSYLAVLGIVTFYERFYNLIESHIWLIDKTWSLVAMSLVAQLATFPITLLYFHQFPVYFLPANLIVIPLSNLVIFSGMSALGISFIPVLNELVGKATFLLIRLLNVSVHYLDSLPASVIHHIRMDEAGTILLYLTIIFFALLLYTKKRYFIFTVLSMILIFSAWNSYGKVKTMIQSRLVVLSLKKHSAISFIQGAHSLILADSNVLNDPKTLSYTLSGCNAYFNIANTDVYDLDKEKVCVMNSKGIEISCSDEVMYVRQSKCRIAVVSGIPARQEVLKKLHIDLLIIRRNPRLSITDLIRCYNAGLIIADASNSVYNSRKWKCECLRKNIRFYDVRSSGSFIYDLGNFVNK